MAMASMLLNRSLLAVCLATPAAAKTTELSCPTYHRGSRLTEYNVFDSDPVRNASLRNDDGPSGGLWDLTSPSHFPNEGYFVVCTYLHGDKVTLKLPSSVKWCRPAGSAFIPNVSCS